MYLWLYRTLAMAGRHGVYQDHFHCKNITKLECGPMPNAMAALPNIGGVLCSTPQSLADARY